MLLIIKELMSSISRLRHTASLTAFLETYPVTEGTGVNPFSLLQIIPPGAQSNHRTHIRRKRRKPHVQGCPKPNRNLRWRQVRPRPEPGSRRQAWAHGFHARKKGLERESHHRRTRAIFREVCRPAPTLPPVRTECQTAQSESAPCPTVARCAGWSRGWAQPAGARLSSPPAFPSPPRENAR